MKLEEITSQERTTIAAYGNGGFRVGEHQRVEGSVLLTPKGYYPWPVRVHQDITLATLSQITEMADDLELLIVGMGENMAFLNREVRAALEGYGIAVEIMATGAAARTYNVLLTEGRQVAAALIAI
tara:strand:+ start:4198 stop:4575 length:378 start_codon:yes stop_codon:yes gene_type:complete